MREFGPKAHIMPGWPGMPDGPLLPERVTGEKNACLNIPINRFRGWDRPDYQVIEDASKDNDIGPVQVPPFVDVRYLDEADVCDPQNQLRILSVSIGKRLGYRIVITDMTAKSERDKLELLVAALFAVGVEHGAEIRDAIAAEREARK